MLENTEEAIKNAQFRETGNIVYTRNKTKTQHNMCCTPLYAKQKRKQDMRPPASNWR